MRYIRAKMHNLNRVLVLLALLSISVFAAQDDYSKEIVINAKRQNADIKHSKVIFFDDVKVTQGSLAINADQLTVLHAGKTGQEVLVATGHPATLSQTLDNGTRITAEAEEVRYIRAERSLKLSGNASLKQADSVVSGEVIRYHIELQQLIAESGEQADSRVTTILLPQQLQEANQALEDAQQEQP